MKVFKKYSLEIIFLTILPLIITLFILPNLPDNLIMHFNLAGEADRIGNKNELIILPLINILLGILLPILPNKNPSASFFNKYSVEFTLVLINIICYIMLFISYKNINNINNFINVFWTFLCLLLVLIGNYLPKIRNNSIIGIRTKWTLSNHDTWYKTHKFSGKLFVICGIVFAPVCFFTSSKISSIIFLTMLILLTITSTIYSYRIFKTVNKI
ncbi:SdpI family protein [uncultured Clostridium sp.]|uniref:SdpI family protein n=1 Tax=uncultured Clostridium sp. TaxID=59620 RepID=UPI0026DCF54C|nr:SdpI family protein [uncultured Clostridium sp.]